MRLRFILVGAFLCACYSGLAAESLLEPTHAAHTTGTKAADDTLEPIILEADFSKEGHFVRTCYGGHFKPAEENVTFYWVLPAECLDKIKHDRVKVNFVYQDFAAELALKDLDYEIHPDYNATTKSNNIALARLPFHLYREAKNGYKYVQLPSANDNFDSKTLELYENKDKTTDNADRRKAPYTVKTKIFNSLWCEILHPLTYIKTNHICVSGQFGEGSSKDKLGAPLIARDADSFKLVGFATATKTKSCTILPKEVEILKIQPYLDWIKEDSRFKNVK